MIDNEGNQLGILSLEEARQRAADANLDLVEVGPEANPPVCRLLDWGKMKYEREKAAREAKKKATTIEVKEVKYRPTIDDHDFDTKTNRALRFLEEGKKVKVTVFFRFRHMRRPELGTEILDRVSEATADMANIDSRSGLEGRQMTMILTPKKGLGGE